MTVHVDMVRGKSAPFPADALRRIAKMKASHALLPRPEMAGRRIAMPRKT
jgi:acyl-CoA thioester hydrolase